MSRLPLLELNDIPEEYHHLFTDEYLGGRHIFRAWAHSSGLREARSWPSPQLHGSVMLTTIGTSTSRLPAKRELSDRVLMERLRRNFLNRCLG